MGHGSDYLRAAQQLPELRFKGRYLSKQLEEFFGNGLRRAGATRREQNQTVKVTVQTIEDIGVNHFFLRRRHNGIPLRRELAQIALHSLTQAGAGPWQRIAGEVNRLTVRPSSKQRASELNGIAHVKRKRLAGCALQQRLPRAHASKEFFVTNRFSETAANHVSGHPYTAQHAQPI